MKSVRALLCSTAICVVLTGVAAAKPAVKLHFSGSVVQHVDGKVALKPVTGLTLHQGDVVVYTIDAANAGTDAALGLSAVGPVPAHTEYVPGSARATQPARIEYSIDGKTWSEHPTVVVKTAHGAERKPAPASAYVSVRFTAGKPLAAKATFHYSYEVSVK